MTFALGDTFAVALAMLLGATLLTTDRGEMEKLAALRDRVPPLR